MILIREGGKEDGKQRKKEQWHRATEMGTGTVDRA
jgi:hypothetical protein